MKKRVCDLCEERSPDAKIKYRYKAKRRWFLWYEEGWDRIELCQECLEKIINAKEVTQYCIKHNEALFFEYKGKRYKLSVSEVKK